MHLIECSSLKIDQSSTGNQCFNCHVKLELEPDIKVETDEDDIQGSEDVDDETPGGGHLKDLTLPGFRWGACIHQFSSKHRRTY